MNAEPTAADQRRYCYLRIGGRSYAVDVLAVREVHHPLPLTAVQGSSSFVRGLVNLRGQIITVVDPAQRLGLPPAEHDPAARLVILKNGAELRAHGHGIETCEQTVALWVDSASDVFSAPVEPVPASIARDSGPDLVEGVMRVGDDLVRLLALSELLRVDGDPREPAARTH